MSHVAATLGDADTAIAAARDAVSIDPSNAAPLEQLASVFADLGDAARLTSVADELIGRFPDSPRWTVLPRGGHVSRRTGAGGQSRRRTSLLSSDPRHSRGLNLLGVICASRGDR